MGAKTLLLVAHAPSPNTQRLRDALVAGARINGIALRTRTPFEAVTDDVLEADGVLLFTPENLGYMSGALKDFFDRIYYPTLERKQGMPYALVVRAGNDGRGTQRAVQTIITGLRWREVADALICRGEFSDAWIAQCTELAAALATGIESGIW